MDVAGFAAGAIVAKMVLDKTGWKQSIAEVKKDQTSLEKFGKSAAAGIKAIAVAAAAAGTAVVASFSKMVDKYVEIGDWIDKMAKRTGISAMALSELAYAADISGAELADVERSVKRMANSIVMANTGLESYNFAFKQIGLNVKDLAGLKPDEQFMRIGAAIARLADDTEKAAMAQQIFGRAGTALLPMFREGEEGIAKLREEAHRLGIVFDEEAAEKAAKLKDAKTALKASIQGLGFAIVSDFIPKLTQLADHLTDMFVNTRDNAKVFVDSLVGFFKIIILGIDGLMLAWHGFQALVFKGAELLAKEVAKWMFDLVIGFMLLEKIPLIGKQIEPVTKSVIEGLKSLTIATTSWREAADEQFEKMTDIHILFEGIRKALDDVGAGFSRMAAKATGATEDVVAAAAALPGAIDLGPALGAIGITLDQWKKWYKKWLADLCEKWEQNWQNMLSWASYFTNQLSAIFSQLHSNQMMRIDAEYQREKEAIESSSMTRASKAKALEQLEEQMEQKRLAAMRKYALGQKLTSIMSAIVNTARAITEALPNIPLSIAVGILGAVQVAAIAAAPLPSFEAGGRVEEDTYAKLHRGEWVVPAGAPLHTVNLYFNIESPDTFGWQRVTRENIIPEILEAIKVQYRGEFRERLGV